ncbi:MAG: hypothetical protein LBI69_03345 [Puniceicoccales bacterium]|jgi:hypothetical protein|nr:hypothetical protein [Puniceicoccales bacterium]
MSTSAITIYFEGLMREKQTLLEAKIKTAPNTPTEIIAQFNEVSTKIAETLKVIQIVESVKNSQLPSASAVMLSISLWMFAEPEDRNALWTLTQSAIDEYSRQAKTLGQATVEFEKARTELEKANVELSMAKAKAKATKAESHAAVEKLWAEANIEAQKSQAEANDEVQKLQAEANAEVQKLQAEADAEVQKLQTETNIEIQKLQAETERRKVEAEADAMRRRAYHDSRSWFVRTFIGSDYK